MAFIEQRRINRRRRRVDKPFAVEHAEQMFLLGDGESQRRPRPRCDARCRVKTPRRRARSRYTYPGLNANALQAASMPT